MNTDEVYYRFENVPDALAPYLREYGERVEMNKNVIGGISVPNVFVEADKFSKGEVGSKKRIKSISMQDSCEESFGTNPNNINPIIISQDLIKEFSIKKIKEDEDRKKDEVSLKRGYRQKMLVLLCKIEKLEKKYIILKYRRRNSADKVAMINEKLIEAREELEELHRVSGLDIEELKKQIKADKTGFKKSPQFLQTILYHTRKFFKKAKKTIKKWSEPIIAGILILASWFVPRFLRRWFMPSTSISTV